MNIPDNIKEIMQKLINNKFEAYIVGGAVRDIYLNIEPHDYDIFTNATGKEILKIFPQGNILGGEERQEKILTVIVDGVEISQYRSNGNRTETGNSLKVHQSTCDFTCNAMAIDINGELAGDEEFSDKCMTDLGQKILRFVGNSRDRIKEDPLRILRGIRFILKYNLTMDSETNIALHQSIDIPKERIRDELIKILSLNNLEYGFLEFIERFLPVELGHENMFKEGGTHHREVPYSHSQYSFLEACKITDNPLIRLSALLHDVGKGVTRTEEVKELDLKGVSITKEGVKADVEGAIEIHFYDHENVGEEITRKWMNEMKFSNDEIRYVTSMVRLHMFGYKEEISDKTYVKFFNKLGTAGIEMLDYIILIYSDHQGNKLKPRIAFGDFLKGNYLYNNWLRILSKKIPFKITDLDIDGHDMMKFGYVGPQIRVGLQELHDNVCDGLIDNRKDKLIYRAKQFMKDLKLIEKTGG